MKIKKRKYKSISDLLFYMHLLEDGMSFGHIHKKYGINEDRLKVLWARYQEKGLEGLHKSRNIKADFVLRKKIVIDIEEDHLTLHAASLKYGASPQRIGVWLKIARTEGINSLSKCKRRGRTPGMGRLGKNSKPLTELERFQKENAELKTEIALLKKVRALVEERNALLREIGHEPSKN